MNSAEIAGFIAGTLQFLVAAYALRLNRLFRPGRVGWSLFCAFSLLALIHLTQSLSAFNGHAQFGLNIEVVYSLISLLLLTGMAHIETLLKERLRAERLEQHQRDELESEVKKKTAYLTRAIEELQSEIEARQKLESQFVKAQKMEVLGQLAGGIAHDFNNMLAAITGFSELILSEADPDSPMRKHAEEILLATGRANTLTRQLLVFSPRQTAQAAVALEINEVVAGMDTMLQRLAGAGIGLTVIPGQNLGQIKADPGQIGQVLMNLVANATDAMPAGGKLTVATSLVAVNEQDAVSAVAPGDYVMLAVSDTGTGMTGEVKAHLFEPFFTTKPKGKGTGLGLVICKSIVKKNGGYIEVHSDLGKGTAFRVYFPQAEPPPGDAEPSVQRASLPRGTETMLLVEDDLAVRQLTQRVLEKQGYTTLLAGNGEEGLKVAREYGGRISLVITDVVMPQMDGRAMAEWLKAIYPGIKILFTSGYAAPDIVGNGRLDSGAAFLPKPFTAATLAHTVRQMLDQLA